MGAVCEPREGLSAHAEAPRARHPVGPYRAELVSCCWVSHQTGHSQHIAVHPAHRPAEPLGPGVPWAGVASSPVASGRAWAPAWVHEFLLMTDALRPCTHSPLSWAGGSGHEAPTPLSQVTLPGPRTLADLLAGLPTGSITPRAVLGRNEKVKGLRVSPGPTPFPQRPSLRRQLKAGVSASASPWRLCTFRPKEPEFAPESGPLKDGPSAPQVGATGWREVGPETSELS